MSKPIDSDVTHPVIRWLMTDTRRRTDACEFLEAFANELRAAGGVARAQEIFAPARIG